MTDFYPWKRKDYGPVLHENHAQDVPFLTYSLLTECGIVTHGFSTRMGGVTTGVSSSMNLSEKAFDTRENVQENYRRIAASMGVDVMRMVTAQQTHTTNIRLVTEQDAGKGVFFDRDYENIDGLITNIPGMTLVTHYADCVPLFFVDPVHKAIGLSHSGWRGTVKRMGRETLLAMKREFGTEAKDVLACIGPSICRDCYEVSEDVAEQFIALADTMTAEGYPVTEKDFMDRKENGKFQLDLWAVNRAILLQAGITEDHLEVTDLCTSCNRELLHSHRATGGKRGLLAAFLSIKE